MNHLISVNEMQNVLQRRKNLAEISLGWVRLLIIEKKKKGECVAALLDDEKKWLARIEETRRDFQYE